MRGREFAAKVLLRSSRARNQLKNSKLPPPYGVEVVDFFVIFLSLFVMFLRNFSYLAALFVLMQNLARTNACVHEAM